ncbi:uncharacterized protein LOC141601676 [Silene latifolia]|uniref:uncharacterized protein LOC141601676 n=1 Tax=Silene latifolia TaxID=37657 RepID=UPI003D76D380
MSCLSLNYRGLDNPSAVSGLRNLIRRESPAIVFLCETKLGSRDMRKVINKIDGYDGLMVDSVGRSGGSAFLWRAEVKCTFRGASDHYMDFDVEIGGIVWRCTWFYGWPAVQDRHLSWRQLRLLAGDSTGPWLCIGDYNEVLYFSEMKGGPRVQWQMNNFRDAVDEVGLRDLQFQGYECTFDNGQEGDNNRQSRIDRAMITESWSEIYPFAKLFHLDREWSDHAPIKVMFDARIRDEGGSKLFRFEHIWVGEDGCEEAMARGWGSGDGKLLDLINGYARELIRWKCISIGRTFLVAKVSAIWSKDGDRNTNYFHRKAGQRREKNFIKKLVNEEGQVGEGKEAISRCAMDYF